MYFRWKPYVPAAARRQTAERTVAKMRKKGQTPSPVTASRGAIAKSFWGKAWCRNLERYSDYSNRLPRGRTYLRNGSVIDLKIVPGEVSAQVVGSSLRALRPPQGVFGHRKTWRQSDGCKGTSVGGYGTGL